MDEFLEDRIYETAKECGFAPCFDEDYIIFRAHSPLGEDISIEIYYDEPPFKGDYDRINDDAYVFKVIVREAESYFKCFNEEDRAVSKWKYKIKSGEPADLQELLDDAKAIKEMYKNLYENLRDLKKEWEEE